MFDAKNDVLMFVQKVREMGGSTDVSFGSPTNQMVGGRYLGVNEAPERGLKHGDALTVYARAVPQHAYEYEALKEKGEGLENGVMVTLTYSPDTAILLALAGCKLNDYGRTQEAQRTLEGLARIAIQSMTRPGM